MAGKGVAVAEILAYCSDCLILKFSLVERLFSVGGVEVPLRELGVRLPFARKPVTLADLGGGAPERVLIMSRVELEGQAFDPVTVQLLSGSAWLEQAAPRPPRAATR